MAREIHLIVVGKLKDTNLEAIEQEFTKRIRDPLFQLHEVKAHAEFPEKEADEILNKIKELKKEKFPLILMDEAGKTFTSSEFSSWLFEQVETHSTLIFAIGGALGHAESLKKKAHKKLSLSPLTFPHKLARIILIEQLYRAITIKSGHPYHH
ncbi:MAG: 23S rRNA (pseudouridine(1915)-N(3))-methyltransferase RlmH [Bacteriovoracaceae bacterium]|nr:23S rRNA (pseudouridine(1915)-N(3))-methyltransferase RlmH [Bacteriovoracaceae bacterium]